MFSKFTTYLIFYINISINTMTCIYIYTLKFIRKKLLTYHSTSLYNDTNINIIK